MFARSTSRWLLLLALIAALAACSPAAAPAPATVAPANNAAAAAAVAPTSTAQAAAAASGPLTVTDDLGRQVTLPAKVTRVISMAPTITEILFAVGAGDQVVGVTSYCNYPPEAQKGREIVGGFTAQALNLEKILALRPDVVFSSGSLQTSVIEALQTARVPVVALEPKDLPGVYANVRMAGQVTGHAAEAEKLAADMERRVAAVQAVAAKIPDKDRVKVFYEVWDEPLMSAGPTSFIGQLIVAAGGINIFDDTREQYPQISAEAVVERNPDFIFGPDSHAKGLTVEAVAKRAGWASVKAVKNARIAIVDGDMYSRSGPRMVDALENLARLLYPDYFK